MRVEAMIGPYEREPARFQAYDPVAAEVAAAVAGAVRDLDPHLAVEHVGSTAVPGCGGKGVVDLAVLYPAGGLSSATAVLDRLGFQPQPGPDPFPESRPMRVGSLEVGNRRYRIHAHVLAAGCAEYRELVVFREALRSHPDLCRAYEARKQAILAGGVADSAQYARIKGTFVREALGQAG